MSDQSWRDADFRDTVPQSSSPRRRLRWLGALLTSLSAVLLVVSWGRDATRCEQSCYGPPAQEKYGSLTYEPGHHWTSYADSWQWGAQHGLAHIALLAALVGLGLAATSQPSPTPAFWIAALAMVTWTTWVLASPPVN